MPKVRGEMAVVSEAEEAKSAINGGPPGDFSPMYGLNVLNHLLFESEIPKAVYPDDRPGYYPNDLTRMQRSQLGNSIYNSYQFMESMRYLHYAY